jgi:phosphohistidine phosphatase
MMVYLFRHGEAEQKTAKDNERTLTREGLMACRGVARKFLARAPIIDKALMSSYERAKQTAVTLRQGFPNLRFEISPLLNPDQDAHELLESLGTLGVQHVILVGHNPCLTRLLSLMLDGMTDTGRQLATSELACVALEDTVPGFGELLYTLKPE